MGKETNNLNKNTWQDVIAFINSLAKLLFDAVVRN